MQRSIEQFDKIKKKINQIGKIQWLPEDEKHKVNAMEEDEAVPGFPM